jgi:uncharacterized protein YcbK (DUF882 family)
MNTRIFSAALGACLAAMMATSAEARIDTGPISSLYDSERQSLARPNIGKNFKANKSNYAAKSGKSRTAQKSKKSGGKYAKKKSAGQYAQKKTSLKAGQYAQKKTSLKARAVTASAGGGGGASRSCLQPQARALLSRIESQFGAVKLISTCRPGAVIAGSGKPSKHRYGLAVDFDAGSRKGAIVSWLMQNHHSGGTMTYASMSHIHVDIGPRFVSLNSGGRRRG